MSSHANLVWCAPVYEATGYADEARGFLSALNRANVPVALRALGTGEDAFRASLPRKVRHVLEAQQRRKLAHPITVVQHYLADGFVPAENVAFQIGRTMFETDSLPPHWVAQCNRLDEIWVPSRFNLETFANAGVTVPMFRVPGGVDTTEFSPDAPPMSLSGVRGTIYLGVFEWIHRKGWDALLRAWADAFTPDDDVTLVLRTRLRVRASHAGHASVSQQIDTFLAEQCGRTRSDVAPIIVLDEPLPANTMASLYTAADAVVTPTRGEGWGRPFMEAMACGKPVIATRWSAHLEYMHDENSLLVDIDGLQPARDEVLDVYNGHFWAEPSVKHLVTQLQRVHGDPLEARAIGARARVDMESNWRWDHAAQIVVGRLREIGALIATRARVTHSTAATGPAEAKTNAGAVVNATANEPAAEPLPGLSGTIGEGSPEHHLFVIWEKGRSDAARILEDLKQRFIIVSATEICWTPENVSANFTRFYGQKLPQGSFKEEHCGTGPLLAIIVRDDHPLYEQRTTSKGERVVNSRTFDAKQLYREWTGGGHKVHATDSADEVRHDVAMLFGESIAQHVQRQPATWDGSIETLVADLAGTNAWHDLPQFFAHLNQTVPYLVLRNFEAFPHEYRPETHGDIDLLTVSAGELAYAANAWPDPADSSGRHWLVRIGNWQVQLDPKTVGDDYYDRQWQIDMLRRRRLDSSGCHAPSHTDYLFSLVYHALLHKPTLEPIYVERLIGLAKALPLYGESVHTFADPTRAKRLLDVFMQQHDYKYVRPKHAGIFYNARIHDVLPAGKVEASALAAIEALRGPLAHSSILSARALTQHNGRTYFSVVTLDAADGSVVKYATDDLAARDGELMARVAGKFVPRVDAVQRHGSWSSVRMQCIPGTTLDRALAQVAATPARCAQFFDDCLCLLQRLEHAAITHRDIHSGNVMVHNGRPMLIDFGWAIAPDAQIFTPDGLGNHGRPPDGMFCDVYAMGQVFRECLPSDASSLDTICRMMTAADPRERVTDVAVLRAKLAALTLPVAWAPTTASVAETAASVQRPVLDPWLAAGVQHLINGSYDDALRVFRRQAPGDAWYTHGQSILRAIDPAFDTLGDKHADVVQPQGLKSRTTPAPYGPCDATHPVVSIVVPVYNQLHFTVNCLDALDGTMPADVRCEVIVVNDASTDDTAEFLAGAEHRYPWLRTVHLPLNGGFAAACNAGAAAARGQQLVFLNNDTTPLRGWLDAMLHTQASEPDIGVVGSVLLFPPSSDTPGAPLRVQHAGIVFRPDQSSTHLYKFCYADQPFIKQSRELQAVTGACVLIARKLFEEVGGFDTHYLNGGEDLELCFRVRERGYRVMLAAESVLWHHESATLVTGHAADNANYRLFLSRWRDRIVVDEQDAQQRDGIYSLGSPRLAIVSPLRPVKSGVSDVVAELIAVLRHQYQIDLFTDELLPDDTSLLAGHRVHPLRDFPQAAAIYHYDATFFHIGNNPHHAAIAQMAASYPGIVELHEYDCRGAGQAQSSRRQLQGILQRAKAVVVHNEHSRTVLQEEFPQLPIYVVPLTLPAASSLDRTREQARASLGILPTAFVIVSLGLVQNHKRNHVTLEAFARFAQSHPTAQLILAGEAVVADYGRSLMMRAKELSVADRVQITGWVEDDAFFDYLGAADVTVNLRYPSRGEESASLVRILGSGRPACVSDYAQYADLPGSLVTHIGFEHEVDELVAAFERFHASPALREQMSAAARSHFRTQSDPEAISQMYGTIVAETRDVSAASVILRGNAYRGKDKQAQVLWQCQWKSVTDPLRAIVRHLDDLGVVSKLQDEHASRSDLRLINAVDANRMLQLQRAALAERYLQVYSGSAARFRRQDTALAAVAYVHHIEPEELRSWSRKPVDEFWVPSAYAAKALLAAGIERERVTVVPSALHGLNYRTNVHEIRPDGVFRFLMISDWSKSSHWDSVLRVYLAIRRQGVNCTLTILSSHQDTTPEARDAAFGSALMEFIARHPQFGPLEYEQLMHDSRSVPEDLMPDEYAMAHAFIAPSTSGVAGRETLEAMALGLPVIGTAHGARAEFLTSSNGFPVPVVQTSAGVLPDERVLQRYMREVVEKRVASQVRGMLARQEILAKRTYVQSTSIVAERLRCLLGGALMGGTLSETVADSVARMYDDSRVVAELSA